MIVLSDHSSMTPAEYLEFEKTSEIRHEYIDGEIYAMAGASKNHNLISGNLYMMFRRALRGTDCKTFIADVRVKLQEGHKYFYPDLVVTCDPTDDSDELFVKNPKLIIEVLSPSTKGFDRRNKFEFYQTIPALQTYLLIDAEKYRVDCFRRQTEDIWTVQFYQGIEAIAHLESPDIDTPLAEIYEGVSFSENANNLGTE